MSNNPLSPEDFGALGDYNETSATGSDDTASIQAVIDHVATQGGGTVRFRSGRVYKTTSQITVKASIHLDMNGSKIVSFLTDANACGLSQRSNSVIENGHVAVKSGGSPGSQATVHAPIRIGALYGNGGTVSSPSPDDDVSFFLIRNMILESDKNLGTGATGGAEGIGMAGNISNGLIENVIIPDNDKMTAGIGLDWGVRGEVGGQQAIVSAPASMGTNKTNFLAGDGFTTHPHNITIRNVRVGKLTRPYQGSSTTGTFGVRLSGTYGIIVEDVMVEQTTEAAFVYHAGDLGFEYAKDADLAFAAQGVSFRNCFCANATNGNAISSDSTGDNVKTAIASYGYTPLHDPTWPSDIVWEQVHGRAGGGSSVGEGIRAFNQLGGELRHCSASGFSIGLRIAGTTDLRVVGGRFSGNRQQGILLNDGALRTRIEAISECSKNNTSAGGYSNLLIENADGTVIDGGVYGTTGTETANHCIQSAQFSDGGKRTSIVNQPTVLSHGPGAYAFAMGSSAAWGTVALFEGATYGAGVSNTWGGQAAVPVERRTITTRYEVDSGQSLTGLVVNRGDTFEYSNPSAGGKRGQICTTAGTVGSGAVLKPYAPIDT